MAIFFSALRTCKLHILLGVVLTLTSGASFAVNIMISPGGISGLSGETMYGPPFGPPCAVCPPGLGIGPTPLLLPPPPPNPIAAPGAYIVDAISSSMDAGGIYHFSVDPAAVGAPLSAVSTEVLVGTAPSQVPPGPAGGPLPPEAEGDIFTIPGPVFGIPVLSVPIIAGPVDEFALGLNVGDDVNGIMNRTPVGGVGTAFYSLAFGGLGLGPFFPGDIVDGSVLAPGPPPGLWAASFMLGLDKGGLGTDDIDALIVQDLGVPFVFDPLDFVAFSLAPGSLTLGLAGLSPGDLLFPGLPGPVPGAGAFPGVLIPAAGFGLLLGDNLNAIDVTFVPVPAAVWLFGSALGLLGWIRRKAT